jgi:putative lipoprotein
MWRKGLVLALGLAGCAAPPKPAPRPPASTPVVAPLSGTWMRPIGSGVAGHEGVSFAADGSFGLIGIRTMNGLTWHVEGDVLVVTTNTGRYPEATESRLHIDELTADRLRLSADAEYLAGSYERDDAAAGRVTGTVSYRERIALPADAALHVVLWDTSDPDDARLVANQTVPIGGRQVPIPFQLTYATADVDASHPYAVQANIVAGGELRFQSAAGTPVLTQGNPAVIDVIVEPAGGS